VSCIFTIAGKLDSKSNDHHGHWSRRHRKSRLQREHGAYATLTAFRQHLRYDPAVWFFDDRRGVVLVRLVRCSPRPLDDDNLRDAFKSIRDGIADQFGVADNHLRLAFEYGQEVTKGPQSSHVRIEISDKEPTQ
jgi:hypothetical protein